MKKELIAAGFFLLSLMSPLKASAANFSQIFVFGDSLSDPGNVFNATRNTGLQLPPSPPYSDGRFSNGKVWIEYAGDELGLTPTLATELQTTTPTEGINFAFGGSGSGTNNFFFPPEAQIPGVLGQVALYRQGLEAQNQQADPNALYVVWGGANDYLFGNVTDVNQTVTNLSTGIEFLTNAGAKNIVVPNLPDLGKLPLTRDGENSSQLTTLGQQHNQALAAALNNFSSKPGVNIIPVDIDSLFNRAQANPSEFGLTNVTDACLQGDFIEIAQGGDFSVCDNPEQYLFWDGVHPTTYTHSIIAESALAAANGNKSIPEPSAGLGMLTLAGLGAAGVIKRKQKQSALIPAGRVLGGQSSHTVVEN